MCAPINVVTRVPRQKAITRAEAATRIIHKATSRCTLAVILSSSSPTDIFDSVVHDISPHDEAVHTNTPHPNIRRSMSLSLTSTATTVASQRFLAIPKRHDGDSALKQLTLRLDPCTHRTQAQLLSHRSGSAAMDFTLNQQAPICRLPVELLSYIFLLGAHTPDPPSPDEETCTDDLGRDDISPCMSSSSTSPDVFASVNRHWRAIALGTPHLWTRIVVTIGDTMNDRAPMFANASRYLSRSAKCPLDIFIDARDPDWDFTEVDSFGTVISPYIDELYDYQHPFRVEHMHHVLNILLPHVRRFRSLAILTDRWAPMQTALDCLSMEIPAFVDTPRPLPPSLPFLESLVLMRCNEFVPYHAEFSPTEGKDSNHLPFAALLSANEDAQTAEPVLPRLKKLILSGVHTDWAALPRLLPAEPTPRAPGLETLELSYHCNDVRPAERDFKALLERCTHLKEFVVRVSGPQSPESSTACGSSYVEEPLPFPHLDSVELGYDDAYTAATILDMLHAPALRHLALEESSSPASEVRVDAEPLLAACTVPAGAAPTPGAPGPFPHLESLALTRVDASAEAFAALYEALPRLRALTVSQMFLLGGEALRPDVEVAFEPPVLPPGRVVEVIEAGGEHVASRLEVRGGLPPAMALGRDGGSSSRLVPVQLGERALHGLV